MSKTMTPHGPFADAATSTTSEDSVTKVNTQLTKELQRVCVVGACRHISSCIVNHIFPSIVNNREK
jgi:hypothetical protein